MSEKPTLVIGDCHGHVDRLEALLLQEGIIGPCRCLDAATSPDAECPECDGDGLVRIDHGANFVLQLGDLGHFGRDGSPTADLMAYLLADRFVDLVLWGNHDRAVVDRHHAFSGYRVPPLETRTVMDRLDREGRMRLAYEAHGFLLTHAGLHAAFAYNDAPDACKSDPRAFERWINSSTGAWLPSDRAAGSIRDAIGRSRGGRCDYGGILWRDASEPLYPFRQVFGHTAKDEVRTYPAPVGLSYCVDVGTEHNGRLAGIWLPEERVVEVHDCRRSLRGATTLGPAVGSRGRGCVARAGVVTSFRAWPILEITP